MAKTPDNQGKCCDAVLRILERKFEGGHRERVTTDGGSSGAGVEVTCFIGPNQFALEHTRIDPYSDRVSDDIRTEQFMAPVIERLDQELTASDNDAFKLVFDVLALAGRRRGEWAALQTRLVEWTKATAPTLDEPDLGRFTSYSGKPAGLPFAVTLQRVKRLTSKVSYMRYEPEDLEAKRGVRVKKALSDKLPKLATYKRDGMSSVLVLEDDDIAISNEALIGAAVAEGLRESQFPAPDAIYLVETAVASLWIVICLKYETATWPDTAPSGSDYHRFDPAHLNDILDETCKKADARAL